MKLAPVPDARALRLDLDEDERGGPLTALIVAELHLGIETELSRAGAHVVSATDRIATQVLALAAQEGASRIIVAGDFKQTIPVTTFQERRDVPRFVAAVTRGLDLHIVLGNHDGGLAALIPEEHDVVLHDPAGIRLGGDMVGGGVGIFHGHAWPHAELLSADELVSAHTHPAVALVDGMGHAHVEPCWVRGAVDLDVVAAHYGDEVASRCRARMTVVPPFNPLLGGAAVNVDGLLGPAGRLLRAGGAEVYLLDGTHLGEVQDLPPVPETWRKRRRRPVSDEL